jgi:hypothetical protein
MKIKLAAALIAGALVGTGLTPAVAPAQAVTAVDISAPNITVKDDACGGSYVTVTGDWASDANNTIETNVTGPNGEYAAGDFSFDERSGSISVYVQLCGDYDQPGWYTVTVRAEGSDENFENATVATGAKTFKFTKIVPWRANTAITRKAKRIGGKYKWKVTGRLIRSGRGYVRQPVAIQVNLAGEWTYIQTNKTKKRGIFAWRFKPNGYTWRYVYYGNSITKPAISAVFTTPRKGRSSREASGDPRSFVSD